MLKRVMFSLALVASAAVQADAASEAKVREAIKALVPSAQIDSVAESKLTGFYEVTLSGQVLYVSADGKYLVQGMVYDIANKRDLTDEKKSTMRKAALEGVPRDRMITFPAKNEKHRVTVFTDIDCGYCRKLHEAVQQYNDAGISIEYVLFPRGGLQSPSYRDSVSVWCADDRKAALTLAKRGEPIEAKMCPNPIQQNLELAQKLGISSTPTIVTEDGTALLGFVPPDQLLAQLVAAHP